MALQTQLSGKTPSSVCHNNQFGSLKHLKAVDQFHLVKALTVAEISVISIQIFFQI